MNGAIVQPGFEGGGGPCFVEWVTVVSFGVCSSGVVWGTTGYDQIAV
ncbi:MAG TPA: hypothetical protein VG937_28565 [Polyangiaceae bacterium]|jgi:hypothetical protein|nr:hypothetical protein [Polyangiaceae bacterium]